MLNRRDFVGSAAVGVGALTVMSPGMAAQAPVMSLNVVYPNREGARFDMAYYRSSHIPLVMKVTKAKSALLIEGVPGANGAAAPFVMIVHFEFASADALKAGLADPAMADVRADVAKFTDITPTVMLGKS